mgnify:CR=1 FL=1
MVDFALLDIDMPGMDGIHLAQALRRLRSDIIIVFATAHPKFAVEALKMKRTTSSSSPLIGRTSPM